MPKISDSVLSIILGGGQGTRLFPLTKERSKPAVPLGGKYRLVDIPISNCINSDLRRIYLLTQFNSASLHRHISQSYKFDHFSGGFVEILAAEQTFSDASWYEGTADAVRKNLQHFLNFPSKYYLILSGDQLYHMDFSELLKQHVEHSSDITIATIPVPRREASALGIMQIDETGRIVRFEEKPKDPALLDSLKMSTGDSDTGTGDKADDRFLASMGIYLFNRDVLVELLDNDLTDFGKHIIPDAINDRAVYSYVFNGYWEDVGTIRNYFESNLDLASEAPRFNFFDMTEPVYTHPRFLPASRINGASINRAVISDGCLIDHCSIAESIVGVRSILNRGSSLERTVMLGNDFYEDRGEAEAKGIPPLGIGPGTIVKNAIIDKNARIGKNCVIRADGKKGDYDGDCYFVRDGIVIIPKGGIVPDGSTI